MTRLLSPFRTPLFKYRLRSGQIPLPSKYTLQSKWRPSVDDVLDWQPDYSSRYANDDYIDYRMEREMTEYGVSDEKVKEILALRDKGKSKEDISKETILPLGYVTSVCRRFPLTSPKDSTPILPGTPRSESGQLRTQVEHLLTRAGFISTKNIARLVGVNEMTISTIAKTVLTPEQRTRRKSQGGREGQLLRKEVLKKYKNESKLFIEQKIQELEEERFLDLDTRYRQGLL